jgi:hypothetical protein
MDALSVLREGIQWGHGLVEQVMADVTPEQAHTAPPGSAHPIAAIYAHALLAEDAIVNLMLRGGTPLFASEWAEACGVPNPTMFISEEWARSLRVDLDALRSYSQAVSASTVSYLDSLTPADLEATHDLTSAGLGQQTVGWMLNMLVAGHLNNMAGELSCLKGLQGLKGYPF